MKVKAGFVRVNQTPPNRKKLAAQGLSFSQRLRVLLDREAALDYSKVSFESIVRDHLSRGQVTCG